MNTVGVVGPGLRFRALTHLLERGGTTVQWTELGDRRETSQPPSPAAERISPEGLRRTHLVFVCVPLHRMTEAARRLGEHLSGRHVLVHLGRTLVTESVDPISELLTRETPTRRVGFVSGPMGEDDVEADRPASAVCASAFPEVIEMVDGALGSASFRLARNQDVVGAEVAATYTRIVAAVCGMTSCLALGPSATSTLFARGLEETARFVEHVGGDDETTFGLAGAGNLHADTTGMGSIDYRIGREVAERGGEVGEVCEELGPVEAEIFDLIDALAPAADGEGPDLPILRVATEVARGEAELDVAVDRLLSNKPGADTD